MAAISLAPKNSPSIRGTDVTIKDKAAYGVICMQGYGRFGKHSSRRHR